MKLVKFAFLMPFVLGLWGCGHAPKAKDAAQTARRVLAELDTTWRDWIVLEANKAQTAERLTFLTDIDTRWEERVDRLEAMVRVVELSQGPAPGYDFWHWFCDAATWARSVGAEMKLPSLEPICGGQP